MMTDLRHALRTFVKNPGFTVIAVVTLALGIGANTAIFTVVHAVLLRPLPYPDAERIVQVWTATPSERRSGHSAADFRDLKREHQSLSALAGYRNALFSVAVDGPPLQLEGEYVTAEFFDVLRAPTLVGRTFSSTDTASEKARAVVLSRSASQQLFGESTDVIGRSVKLNGEPHAVIGVLAAHAQWPPNIRLYVLSEKEVPPSPVDIASDGAEREVRYFEAIGRLKDGVSLEQARTDFARVASLLQQRQAPGTTPRDLKTGPIREEVVGDVRSALLVLQGAVGLVLLIACANVSSLMIARAAARGRELAIRAALGAARGRLVRHLLVESLALGVIGGTAGLLLAAWLVGLLVSILPEGLPRSEEISLDFIVAAVTLTTAVGSGLLFGVLPALQASRADGGVALRGSGERGSSARARGRAALVVAEIALTLVLLVGAGLLINSFMRLQRTDSGFRPESVTVMSLAIPQSRYRTGASQVQLYQRLIEGLSQRPEVQAVGVGFPGPLRGSNASGSFNIEDRPARAGVEQPFANIGSVSGGYFAAMGVPLVAGRTFTDADRDQTQPVAVVSVALARRYWPGQNALGKRLRFGDDGSEPWIVVVGIVGDARQLGLDREPPPVLYIPYQQFPLPFTNLAVRSSAPESAVVSLMRTQLAEADADLPAVEVASLGAIIDRSMDESRFRSQLLGAFAITALVLAAVGVYGLISYSVTQRRREIGIRVALGAQPRQVLGPVVREGLALALVGTVIGLAGAFAAARGLSRFLFGVSPADPLTFTAVSALLIAVALLATYIPSRRALHVDPASALRTE